MANTNSFGPDPGKNITRVMRRVFGASVPAAVALSAAVAVIFAIAIDGCSSKTNKPQAGSSKASDQALALASSPPIANFKNESVTTKERSATKRFSKLSYYDSGSGVSFRYPRGYTLVSSEKANVSSDLLKRVPMNFVQPGGVTVATLELPGGAATSLFDISINRTLTSQQCDQFADPDLADIKGKSPVDSSDESIPSKVKLHGIDFMRVESGTEQTDTRYYHHYESGACYEFVLAVAEKSGNTIAADHFQRFDNMEGILASVKIKPDKPEVIASGVPTSSKTQ